MSALAASSAAVSLDSLRERIGLLEGHKTREFFPFDPLSPGIPRGALTEISGPGKTELVAQFLARNPRLRAAWIEPELSVYPCALLQRKVSLGRVLFAEAGEHVFWTVSQILRSQLFEVVILSGLSGTSPLVLNGATPAHSGVPYSSSTITPSRSRQTNALPLRSPAEAAKKVCAMNEKTLRNFQLAAEKARVSLILLNEEPMPSWPISLQLQVTRSDFPSHLQGNLEIDVLKRRG